MIYIHRSFQDMVETLGLPGMPHIFRRETVAAIYEEATGYTPKNLDFYTTYAALRHGIVMFRITRRSHPLRRGRDAREPRRGHHAPRPAAPDARRGLLGRRHGVLRRREPGAPAS